MLSVIVICWCDCIGFQRFYRLWFSDNWMDTTEPRREAGGWYGNANALSYSANKQEFKVLFVTVVEWTPSVQCYTNAMREKKNAFSSGRMAFFHSGVCLFLLWPLFLLSLGGCALFSVCHCWKCYRSRFESIRKRGTTSGNAGTHHPFMQSTRQLFSWWHSQHIIMAREIRG